MDLTSFEIMLNENKRSVMSMRMKELRALNKPADQIIKEFAQEFYSGQEDALEKAKKMLVGKTYLKNFMSMTPSQLENLPKKEMEKLRNRYSKYMDMKEFNRLMKQKSPHKKILDKIVEKVVENG